MAKYLNEAGISFIEERNYKFLSAEHENQLIQRENNLELEKKQAPSKVQAEAEAYAATKAKSEIKSYEDAAHQIYDNKICNDPEYKPFADAPRATWDAYNKAFDNAYIKTHTSDLGFLVKDFLGFNPVQDNIDRLKEKHIRSYIPDDALLHKLAGKYTSGWVARCIEVIPYEPGGYLARAFDTKLDSKTYNLYAEERAIYQKEPSVMAGFKREQTVKDSMYKEFYSKHFTPKFNELKAQSQKKLQYQEDALRKERLRVTVADSEEISALTKKLLSNPAAMEGIVNFTYDEVKKRDNGMDKGFHVAMITYSVQYKVETDQIRYYYESQYSNPLSSFIFADNNYQRFANDAQCSAVALTLGELLCAKIRQDPVFEMASISAEGNRGLINLKISYPNSAHQQSISLF